jgi:uncharacterized coiled-coil DUF342 family protein
MPMPTNSVDILTDDQVAEIFAEDHAEMCGDALYCNCGKVTRDALVQTVRALRGELDATLARVAKFNDLNQTCAEQLAAVTQERDRFSELADKRHDELCEARRQRDSLAAYHVEYTREAMTAAVKDFRTHAVKICKDKAAEWEQTESDALAEVVTHQRGKATGAYELAQLLEKLQ